MPDPDRIDSNTVVAAVTAAFARGPALAAARIAQAIRSTVPELAPWAVQHVAAAVARGDVPPAEVVEALSEAQTAVRRPQVRSRGAVAASILKVTLGRHGVPWRKTA